MSVEINHNLGRAFFAAQDRLRGGPDAELCASNYIANLGSAPPTNLAGHQQFAAMFYAAFPDLRHTVEDTVASDEKVAVRFLLTGTHTGNFMGIPPTGKSIAVTATAILHLVDGKVAELRGIFDQLGLMQQLGQ